MAGVSPRDVALALPQRWVFASAAFFTRARRRSDCLAVKLAVAAYLVFLGLRALLQREHALPVPAQFKQSDPVAAFRQGILTNVLNPKVALFFLAFLPQFIDSATQSKIAAFVILGFTFVTTGTIWCLVLAWFAAVFSARLRGNAAIAGLLNRAVGSLFVFLGLRLAVAARQ